MNPSLAKPPQRLVIATRESRLAMWQAVHVQSRLQLLYPQCKVEILGMSTRGDQILDRPLAQIGGKGLFIKELEVAMHEGRADLAVHSLKDVPMEMPEGFELTAIMARETPFDALVSNRFANLGALPAGAVVGTSSLRREATLRAAWPHLRVEGLRGNLDTRLRKLDEGQYDAIILAAAGLIRLGIPERIASLLDADASLPAPGQGALGIEILAARPELAAWIAPLHDARTAACVAAERSFSQALGGSCQLPLGGYAVLDGDGSDQRVHLRGFVASADGQRMLRGERRGPTSAAAEVGRQLANELRTQGAASILAAVSPP